MNFFSSSTGSTTEAMGMLMRATSKSAVGYQTLKSAFNSMVDAGADSKQFIEDMLPLLGDFEVKTGVGIQQFATMSTKFEQMFGEKKGITKDIQDLQKALIGTGLKGSQLEQTMQGLTEAAEKLGFATQGATLNIKELSKSYGQTAAVFKAFGVNTQTTSNFLNGLVDPENIEKNMLLMNKMGISYQEFNDMLNSGQGQDKFFDKIINNVGKVAQEANLIQDASTRYKYLKDTLGLPPEIANKLMKVTPSRMQAELRKIKREMEDAEKKEKWRKDLKQREEKYEEAMMFLRMEMVAPLVGIINKNRGSIMRIMQALKPIFQIISNKLAQFLEPFAAWLERVADGINSLNSDEIDLGDLIDKVIVDFVETFGDSLTELLNDDLFNYLGEEITSGFLKGAGKGLAKYLDFMPKSVQTVLEKGKDLFGINESEIASAASGIGEAQTNAFASVMKKASSMALSRIREREIKSNSKQFNTDADLKLDNKIKTNDESERVIKGLKQQLESNDKNAAIKSLFALQTTLLEKNDVKDVENYINDLEKKIFGTNSGAAASEKNYFGKTSKFSWKDNTKKTTKTPPVKFDKKATEDIKTITNSSNLSNEEVQAAVSRLMNDKGFMATVSSALVSVKDKRINELQTQVNTFLQTEKALREEFNALKNESTNGILIKWQDEFFGEKDDSIRNILLRIDDAVTLNDEKTRNIAKKQYTVSPDVTKLNSIMNNNSTGFTSAATGGYGLLSNASNVKNVQLRQSIYLKSIAESTLDSAKYLRYIGNNLIFTRKGLATTSLDTTQAANAKLYGLGGGQTDFSAMSGFGALSSTPSTSN
jgi:hypothetical protein